MSPHPSHTSCGAQVLANPLKFAKTLYGCKIVKWQEKGRFPLGEFTVEFGRAGDVEAETAAILHVCIDASSCR